MNRALACFVLCACLLAPCPARAATPTPGPAPVAKTQPRTPGRSAARSAAAAARPAAAPRTLEDIRIEGEIRVPQVLFITARDQWRMLEFQHRRYLRTGAQLGQATEMPGWIVVTLPTVTAGKEIAR